MSTPALSRAAVIEHTNTLRRFLDSRWASILPRRVRKVIQAMTDYVYDQEATVVIPHLTERPVVGTPVLLLRDSWYLRNEHGARIGAIGTIVQHSHLSRDDDGALVDWGDARRVRSNLDELAAV